MNKSSRRNPDALALRLAKLKEDKIALDTLWGDFGEHICNLRSEAEPKCAAETPSPKP